MQPVVSSTAWDQFVFSFWSCISLGSDYVSVVSVSLLTQNAAMQLAVLPIGEYIYLQADNIGAFANPAAAEQLVRASWHILMLCMYWAVHHISTFQHKFV